ncbi:hypothetical protein DFH06DRAFT_1230462 [Mycena polygramma]|nr:hypothetical protein DFH06DRAFT_1230462 [Mycena polygramma]
MEPRFPPELERKIFETAALADPQEILVFCRAARRVWIWTEPLLYSVLWVHAANATSLWAALACKTAGFSTSAVHVRHLFLGEGSGLSQTEIRTLVAICPNLVDFAVYGLVAPGLLAILGGMQLRRFTIDLQRLFRVSGFIDFKHPMFVSVTHLDILRDIADTQDLGAFRYLAMLPALTHLCLGNAAPLQLFRDILSRCKSLEVLINA